jgi:D-alanine-D-alanine ligase
MAMSNAPPEDCLRIAVLSGGTSQEREVSLASGQAVQRALQSRGHRVETLDPAVAGPEQVDWTRFDACFLCLHGGEGEDGRIQRRLARLGVAYTGSGPAASRRAMSKTMSKRRFLAAGVPTPAFVALHRREPLADRIARAARLGFPLVVKPDGQGSSLGVGRADGTRMLAECLLAAEQYGPRTVAEPYVCGVETTISVLGRRSLPPVVVMHNGPIFDYGAKYHAPGTEYFTGEDFPGLLPPAILRATRKAAVAACAALGTRGLARVDVMVDAAGRPWVLEVNTIPGMTERSLAPRAAALAGLALPQLCERLVHSALRVHRRRMLRRAC